MLGCPGVCRDSLGAPAEKVEHVALPNQRGELKIAVHRRYRGVD
jgi:hypothetical protein